MFMHPLIYRGGEIFISKAQCVTVSSDAGHGVVLNIDINNTVSALNNKIKQKY